MEIRFFDGGYCRQLLFFIDRRSWQWVRFHAVFLVIKHPREGWVLIDTGYGGRFREATEDWPYCLYRYVTPATMAGTASDALRSGGIDPAEIHHLIVTHFHADHVGGLGEFAHAKIHYNADAWKTLAQLAPFRQLRAAYLPKLIPDWLPAQSQPISAEQFSYDEKLGFPVHDLFGAGLIKLIDLPGHAPGQVGVLIQAEEGQVLYAADAFWRSSQIDASIDLLPPALHVQWDRRAYQRTIESLRVLQKAGKIKLLACHSLEAEKMMIPAKARV